ncbi:hypothetical protein VTK26DRAFT_5401 [Humicola hyalothermophila]
MLNGTPPPLGKDSWSPILNYVGSSVVPWELRTGKPQPCDCHVGLDAARSHTASARAYEPSKFRRVVAVCPSP